MYGGTGGTQIYMQVGIKVLFVRAQNTKDLSDEPFFSDIAIITLFDVCTLFIGTVASEQRGHRIRF